MKRIFLISLLALTGCADPTPPRHVVDTVDVSVPILERAVAPNELFRSKIAADQVPHWVAPTDPSASVCLPKTAEPMLKSIILRDESLLDGWEAYAF